MVKELAVFHRNRRKLRGSVTCKCRLLVTGFRSWVGFNSYLLEDRRHTRRLWGQTDPSSNADFV